MAQYLVAIHHPDDYDPAVAEDDAMHRDIDVLNDEMVAAGVRVFVGGLHPARSSKPCRARTPACRIALAHSPVRQSKFMNGSGRPIG